MKPQIVDESVLTTQLAKCLQSQGWEILSIHYPGSTGGLIFHKRNRTGRGMRGAYIPDLVGMMKEWRLIVETKPYYHRPDIVKLTELRADEAFRESLLSNLDIDVIAIPNVILGICFPHPWKPASLDRIDKFIYFEFTEDGFITHGSVGQHLGEQLFGVGYKEIEIPQLGESKLDA